MVVFMPCIHFNAKKTKNIHKNSSRVPEEETNWNKNGCWRKCTMPSVVAFLLSPKHKLMDRMKGRRLDGCR